MMPGAGPDLDELIANRVLRWCKIHCLEHHIEDYCAYHKNFRPSTDIASAWKVVAELAPLVGDFQHADGFFILKYADSAGHGNEDGSCDPGEIVCDEAEEEDISKWSCHFHPGHPGASSKSAELFECGKNICARGSTAPHAICLTALKLYGVKL